MTPLPKGFVRAPNAAAAVLIWLAVQPLPAAHRDRYRDEFRAEICFLNGRQQVLEAVSVLAGSLPLSRALQEDDDMTIDLTHSRSVRCQLGRHRYQTINGDNAENRQDRHRECLRCGKIKEMDMYEPSDGRYLGGYGPLA